MWKQNSLTERLNLKAPIFQAPMGSTSTPAMAAAVSNTGGVGGLGMWGLSSDDVRRRIQGFRQQSSGALNVNYPHWTDTGDLTDVGLDLRGKVQNLYDAKGLGLAETPERSEWKLDAEHLEMLAEMKPEVVSFHFGLPDGDVVGCLKERGVYVICSATTVSEARQLQAGGVDAIIAQGAEAGGHRGTFTDVDVSLQPGLFSLLPQVVDAVDVPVIAAGGVSDGRTIAAAMMLGASAVQMGTAFLRCDEANVSDTNRAALNEVTDANTVITPSLSGRPARALKNELVSGIEALGEAPMPFPAQLALTEPMGRTENWQDAIAFVGQSIGLTRPMPAGDLVETLIRETDQCLSNFMRG